MVSMGELFILMHERGASDLHLTVGAPPILRVDGMLVPTPFEKLNSEMSQQLIYSLLNDQQRQRFEATNELDLAFNLRGIGRVRMNVYRQTGSIGAAVRAIPNSFKTFEEIGMPKAIHEIMKLPKGLVLVTGPTGSGKSTTLACLMEMINSKYTNNVLTVEDPLEFVYESKKSVIRQREVGQDTKSFANALKASLREDPDVILVGEMRDLETIQLAITAAETGHLCFGTLHTQDAPSTIDRIIDVFPPHQQTQIRVQLATVLQGVVSQILVPRKDGQGRVAAREIMLMTPAISNLIRDSKTHMLYGAIDTGAKFGMIPMDRALAELVKSGMIDLSEAVTRAHNPEVLKQLATGGAAARPAAY